ncbi:nucleotidyltransferase domain-containing protein [Pseudoduganella sp. R-34]|uniref:nucleotidyltransferase domain-containing protein n=1 Tax=Pseudoduganella sp. R-34 TaxID=3404062 RepID=UPI003CF3C2DF
MKAELPLLLRALRAPQQLAGLPPAGWDLLLRQAANANLSATLHDWLERHGVLAQALPQAREQLAWAAVMARRHRQATYWEIRLIGKALAGLGVPLLLLKGGAYAAAGLPPAAGRLFSDIDILVPEDSLPQVEAALMRHGWVGTHHDSYDQRYYREWMHELPPMMHVLRQTAIDVHHTILPRTAAQRPDARLLRAAARPLAGAAAPPGSAILAPLDMVLHSATHLFADGEFDKGLRDLWDLHCLLTHFGANEPGFWAGLPARARQHQLQRFMFYGLRYSAALLGTEVPPATLAAMAPAGPQRALLAVMDALFMRALLPHHPSCRGAGGAVADFLLYVRGNWLRMPPLRLARHLFHKALLTPKNSQGAAA